MLQLKSYEQVSAEIEEYVTPAIDEDFDNLNYETFLGMSYKSDNIEYQIFAYEFSDEESALMYYSNVMESPESSLQDSSENNVQFEKTFFDSQYRIIGIEGNKAYKILSSNLFIDKIDKMLSDVFSIEF